MSKKIYKVLDDRNRITIPRELRWRTGISANDVISLERTGDEEITIRKERMKEKSRIVTDESIAKLANLLEGMSSDELREAIICMAIQWRGWEV